MHPHSFLILIYGVLQIADGVTTFISLKRPDRQEGNKLLKAIQDKIGTIPMLIISKALALALGVAIYIFGGIFTPFALGALCLFYGWVVFSNMRML